MSTAVERQTAEAAATWHAEWVVGFGPRLAVATDEAWDRQWTVGDQRLTLSGLAGSDVSLAEDSRYVVLFTGLLTNVAELHRGAAQSQAASLVLALLQQKGSDAFADLRGPFAVVVWDRDRNELQIARDQVGLQPIYYARGAGTWWVSPWPDALVSRPGVSRDPDVVAMAEWLCGWFPAVEDTTYREVKRVAPGSVLTLKGATTSLRKYWDPFPEGADVSWLREGELDQFDELFLTAVARTLEGGAPSIFLSGGLDSIAVAVTASDLAAARGLEPLLALSLEFPDEVSNEAPIQTGVARQLGLEQELVPFVEAIGPRGMVAEALALSADWPQPMWNIWAPAYMTLARRAAGRGRQLILTGRGGDEWLTISPYLIADLMLRGNIAGIVRLLRMRRRSNKLTWRHTMRLVWLTGCRPVASATLDFLAPRLWHQRRRRRLLSERPDWVAPDPAIRKAMDERVDRFIDPARPVGGFYQREGRAALRHPAITHDMEETQEFGRRHGMRMLHPFWDVDLIELAHRVPPRLLMKDGRSKYLLRRRLATRLPGLGLEHRGKVSAAHVFEGIMQREAPAAMARLGGPKALTRLGVVRMADIESEGHPYHSLGRWGGSGRYWTVLNLETWVRRRS